MTIGLIDIGNSRIKWGIATADGVRQTRAVFHREEAAQDFATVLGAFPESIERIVACNVAGAGLGAAFERSLADHFAVPCDWVSTGWSYPGLQHGYRDPAELGVDRWVALIGSFVRCPGPSLVVDAGTACTLDALRSDGRHGGGVILPGIHLMRGALFGETNNIAPASGRGGGESASELFCTSTASAVNSGCLTALLGAVERAYHVFRQTEGAGKLIITGGDAPAIINRLDVEFEHRPALVLEGLAAMATVETEQ